MKKILAAILLATSSFAQDSTPGPWDLFLQQINGDVTAISPVYLHPPASSPGVFIWQGSGTTSKPWLLPFTGGLVLSSGTLTIDGSQVTGVTSFSGTIPTSQVSGLAVVATSGSFSSLLAKPTTLSGYGITDAYPLSGNPSNFLTSINSGQVTAALGFTPYNAANPSSYITQAGARTAISLTTNGTSGAATYNNSTGVFNIPQYAPGAGTVTSVTAGTGLSGGIITTSGTIALSNTGSAGTYTTVTTDAQGRVTAGTAASVSTPSRTLNSAFQISTARSAIVSYSVDISATLTLTGGATGTVFLEYADDSGFTTNVVTVQSTVNGNTGTLTIGLSLTQTATGTLTGFIPAGKYVRIRTANTAGTPGFTFRTGMETLM